MVKAWTKNNLREIVHTLGRYLAIVGIILVGSVNETILAIPDIPICRTSTELLFHVCYRLERCLDDETYSCMATV